jgi:tetratricopeptide (TPR) repeat protein
MPPEVAGPSNPLNAVAPVRLDSWKQIAAYLCRGERTVKRWETERGLPVHRLPGGGRGSVHAFPAELDQWLVSARALETEVGVKEGATEESDADATAHGEVLPEAILEAQPASPPASPIELSAGAERSGFRRTPVLLLMTVLLVFTAAAIFFALRGGGRNVFIRDAKPARAPISESERQLAHQLYLQGRFEWNKRTPESLNRALDDFTQALVHDPEDARTYAGLADTYNLLREFSAMPENEAYARALAASRKAVELDDSLAEAHRSLAFAEVYGEWNFRDGVREFRRAIELNPTDPLAHLWLANALAKEGWSQQALSEIDRAQELDPTSPSILADKGGLVVDAGRVREGIGLLKQVESTYPESISPHRYLAGIYMRRKDYPGFLAESAKTAQMTGDPVRKAIAASAQEGFLRDGERGLLQGLYTAQKKYHEEGKLPGISLARTCVLIGRRQEAVQLLGEDYARHEPAFLDLLGDSDLAPLTDEPEVRKMLSSIQISASEDGAAAMTAVRE